MKQCRLKIMRSTYHCSETVYLHLCSEEIGTVDNSYCQLLWAPPHSMLKEDMEKENLQYDWDNTGCLPDMCIDNGHTCIDLWAPPNSKYKYRERYIA